MRNMSSKEATRKGDIPAKTLKSSINTTRTKRLSFPLMISAVNVASKCARSAVFYGFCHIY